MIRPCHCGQHELAEWAPWIAFPHEIHTATRCGPYLALGSTTRKDRPVLHVTWETPIDHAPLGR